KIFLTISIFSLLSLVSVFFAFDSYIAFWGIIERFGGFTSIFYLWLFFVLIMLVFEKEDWNNFFKISIIIGIIVLCKEFYEYFLTGLRSDFFFGNPIFFAEYLLFIIASGGIVFSLNNQKFWRWFSAIVVLLSFFGLLISGTRGAILGFVLGLIFIGVYFL